MATTVSELTIPATAADTVVYVLNVGGFIYPGPFMEGLSKLTDVTNDITWDFGSLKALDAESAFVVVARKLADAGFEAQ